MSRSFGAGSPISFKCPVERRESMFDDPVPRTHKIRLTGRHKPYVPPRAIGSRSTFVSREYVCSCGHIGWSNHVDLERAERLQTRGRP